MYLLSASMVDWLRGGHQTQGSQSTGWASVSKELGNWDIVKMYSFPLNSGIDGTNKPPDISTTESWYDESENNETDIKRATDMWKLGDPAMGRVTYISDFLVLLTPFSHETWLPLVPWVL